MVCVSSCNNIAHLSTFLTPVSFPSLLDLSHQHENMLLLLFTKKKKKIPPAWLLSLLPSVF